MAEDLTMRLSLAAKKINRATSAIVERLSAKGIKVENNPNTKLTHDQLQVLAKEFNAPDLLAQEVRRPAPEPVAAPRPADNPVLYFRETRPDAAQPAALQPTAVRPIPVAEPQPVVAPAPAVPAAPVAATPAPEAKPEPKAEPQPTADDARLPGLKVLGKIDLDAPRQESRPAEPTRPSVAPAPKPEPQPTVVQPVATQPPAPQSTPAPEATPQPVEAKAPVAPPTTVPAPSQPPRQEPPRPQQPRQPEAQRPAQSPANPVSTPPAQPPAAPPMPEKAPEPELIEAKADRLQGLKVLGKIELPVNNGRGGGGGNNGRNPVASSDNRDKKKRKRINKPEGASDRPGQQRPGGGGGGPQGGSAPGQGQGGNRPPQQGQGNRPGGGPGNRPNQGTGTGTNAGAPRPGRREEPSEKEIQDQIKATMARLAGGGNRPNFGADRRRDRRRTRAGEREAQELQAQEESKNLKVTEFISANDLASLMNVSVNEVISICMNLGMFVSINQRLDAEAITIIADEFGYAVQFVSAEEETEAALVEVDDAPEDLLPRAPIVTIMGHVDHGKTSLLDYIRRTKVAAGEAGGITQHIGAYDVETDSGKRITFLDTPGHEAFTAMRARGAQVTDVVIIVIAADDSVMPQTREAINHAQNANVPIVFAFSKVDKAGADTEKIRQELAQMNLLVEEWGGKYQTQEISSKSGLGVADLLEKVLLEAELLELKANPSKRATGAVIEASLDKGRGYVTTILVQTGTLRVGDVMLAGAHFGRVKAMFDHRGQKMKEAGPSTPAQVLGLNGAPQAGDKLNGVEGEREAREIANKREQILREQSLRTRKHITLEEIGRRKAIGTFRELNVIVKGDVDGSVEALSDSLLKLSTEEVQVRIVHKGVGQVSESDVLLASASDAIVVAFQVRPSVNARRIAEQEQIEIRTYSIIYDAINEVKDAMEGLLAPTMEENVTATIEVREVFKISKIGTVAGCYVTDGTIKRNNKVRVLRDFVVIHDGEISALKRFKDDVGEVRSGYECGLSVKNFNDIELGDIIEGYEMKEVKRTL